MLHIVWKLILIWIQRCITIDDVNLRVFYYLNTRYKYSSSTWILVTFNRNLKNKNASQKAYISQYTNRLQIELLF